MPIVVTCFISLDGVVQSVLSPDEDTDGGFTEGGWVSDHMDDEVAAFMGAATTRASAMLLGRRTYEGFARVWSSASTSNPAVAAMNRMPKYVASRTLTTGSWANTHILGPDLEHEVKDLVSADPDGEVAVFGSSNLLRTLAHHRLVDRYQLLTFPLVLGSGKRMFAERGTLAELTLRSSRTTVSGVVISTYTVTPGRSSGPASQQ
jgi:dihydrofolate reductase